MAALLQGQVLAQATLLVGPGGYPEIRDAIVAAQPGDLILVQPGTYLPFELSIGVRIVAPTGATVTTPPGGGSTPWIHPIQPPAGQGAQIVGLTFVTNPIFPPAEPPVTLSALGNVVFADCVFQNWSDYVSNAVICNGDVQFDRCTWQGVWDGLSVLGGRVIANSCTFTATRVNWAGSDTKCLVATAGDITLNFCTLRGSAADGQPSFIGSAAIRLDGTARLTVADCQIHGGDSISIPSIAIVNNTANPVQHARSTILGGVGLLSQIPTQYGPGPAFSGPAQIAAVVGGGGSATGPLVGAPYLCAVFGPSNSIALLVLSLERTAATPHPLAAQELHFDPATATAFAAGVMNGYSGWPGAGSCLWTTVTLTPAMRGLQFWLHPLVWDNARFQVGPTCGGVVR